MVLVKMELPLNDSELEEKKLDVVAWFTVGQDVACWPYLYEVVPHTRCQWKQSPLEKRIIMDDVGENGATSPTPDCEGIFGCSPSSWAHLVGPPRRAPMIGRSIRLFDQKQNLSLVRFQRRCVHPCCNLDLRVNEWIHEPSPYYAGTGSVYDVATSHIFAESHDL